MGTLLIFLFNPHEHDVWLMFISAATVPNLCSILGIGLLIYYLSKVFFYY